MKPSNRKLASYILASVALDYLYIRVKEGMVKLTPSRRRALVKIAKELAR